MPDLATELANLNAKATELLAKYNGAFERLDKESQKKLVEIQSKAEELKKALEDVNLSLKINSDGILVKEDGSEISVGNALKLGGKSLEEVRIKVFSKQFNTSIINITNTSSSPRIIDELSFENFEVKAGYKYVVIGKISSAQGIDDDSVRFHARVYFGDILVAGDMHEYHHSGWETRNIDMNGVFIPEKDETLNVTTQVFLDNGGSIGFNWHGWDEQISSIIILEVPNV